MSGRPRTREYPPPAPVVVALRARRLALGLTQQQVAAGCGMHHQYVSQVEVGANVPNIATLERILAVVGLRLAVEEVAS